MKASLITQPVLEPITLAELKLHLRVDSGTFDDNLGLTQCLAYGAHAVFNEYTTHVGTGVDVLGKTAEVIIHSGTNGATGTNDTRIEESDQLATGYTAWTGGAFTQITTTNDNADYKKAYTGTKRYIRTASKVLLAACEFGTSILTSAAISAEDDLLTGLITSAREHVEKITSRRLLTQTWDYFLDHWPGYHPFQHLHGYKNKITLPFGNLQNTAGVEPIVSYLDSAGNNTILTVSTDYLVETNKDKYGAIVLPYGKSWPSTTLYPSNPITIRFVCGWISAALIPNSIKTAVKFVAEDLYYHGERHEVLDKTVRNLLLNHRLWREF